MNFLKKLFESLITTGIVNSVAKLFKNRKRKQIITGYIIEKIENRANNTKTTIIKTIQKLQTK